MTNYNSSVRREEDVGITLILGTNPTLRGIFKHRFSDFHVNEIDPEGRVVHLASLDPPPINDESLVALDDPEIKGILNDDIRQEVVELQKRIISKDKEGQLKVKINVTVMDKITRTKIHKWISTSFNKLSSETEDGDGGEKYIKVVPKQGNSRNQRRPDTRARYTHCVLYKEGLESSDAIGILSKKLQIKPGLISYAGIKDKRSKSTQRIALSNIDPSRLIGISKSSPKLKLGNYSFSAKPIFLGELNGNQFRILLRNISLPSESNKSLQEIVGEAEVTLKTKGFINYFGMQRFGSFESSTASIGRLLLKQEWEKAFDAILQPQPKDRKEIAEAKKIWLSTRNASKALEALPSRHFRSMEINALHGLSRAGSNDWVGAFVGGIPRGMRLLYTHAYQSLLWNKCASWRITTYGLKPVVGDLVYATQGQKEFHDILLDDEEALAEAADKRKGVVRVRTLTKEDIASESFTMEDVLLPLYGSEVSLPGNGAREYLLKCLEEDGLTCDNFLKYRPVNDAPRGAYRRVICLPKDVNLKLGMYSSKAKEDELDSIIPSDLDKLKKDQRGNNQDQLMDSSGNISKSDSDLTWLLVQFSLPPSAYATMALREILYDPEGIGKTEVTSSRSSSGTVNNTQAGSNDSKLIGDAEVIEDTDNAKRPKLS